MDTDPSLKAAQSRVDSLEHQLQVLENRAQQLDGEVAEARARFMKQYLERLDKRFEGFDWKKALAGAQIHHSFVLEGVLQLGVGLPSGKVSTEVREYREANPGKMTANEETLLQWVVSLRQLANPTAQEMNVRALTIEGRLVGFRQLPEVLLAKLADLCETLHAWINAKMETELGNC
jgi:hypothetical protein